MDIFKFSKHYKGKNTNGKIALWSLVIGKFSLWLYCSKYPTP